MTRRQRLEAAAALALLPVGALLALFAALAVLVSALAAFLLPFVGTAGWGWLELWLAAAALAGARIAVGGIETMSSLNARVLRLPLALTAAIVATCPLWWLGDLPARF